MKILIYLILFILTCVLVSGQTIIISQTTTILPYEATSSNQRLVGVILENTGELENYTITNYTAKRLNTYSYDNETNSTGNDWNITLEFIGDDPKADVVIKTDGLKVIGTFERNEKPLNTNINFVYPISNYKVFHFGEKSLIINFTIENVLIDNNVNDVFIYNITRDIVNYLTWFNDTSLSWWLEANETVINSSAAFDGTTDSISIPADPSFNLATNMTFEFWIKATPTTADLILSKNVYADYYIQIVHTTNALQWGDFATCWDETAVGLFDDGVWTHVVLAKNASRFVSYKNGVQHEPPVVKTCDFSAGANALRIGAKSDDPAAFDLDGWLDEFKIYNRTLEATEVLNNYDRAVSRLPNNITNGLVLYLPFTQDASDESGEGNDGTFIGDARITGRSSTTNFPLTSYLIASDEGLDILDASDDSLWMRFSPTKAAGTFAQQNIANVDGDRALQGVSAINGNIYFIQVRDPATNDNWGSLNVVDFINDNARKIFTLGDYDWSTNISMRNRGDEANDLVLGGWNVSVDNGLRLLTGILDFIDCKTISAFDYCFLGGRGNTAGSVTLINWTANTNVSTLVAGNSAGHLTSTGDQIYNNATHLVRRRGLP